MSRISGQLLISAILLTLSSAVFAKADTKSLESFIEELIGSAAIPGISFGLIEKDKQPIYLQVGLSDTQKNQKVTSETIFQAASLSKPVLAFIALRLAEKEELSLDQPLYEILENSRIENKPWGKLITARHVLSHQTGFPNWSNNGLEMSFKPGSDFNYSGEGYVYLQQVLEKVSGLSLQTLAEKEVFKPLKMKDSYFTWSESLKLNLAKGHDRAGNQVKRGIPEPNAASSLHTTSIDYLKFVQAWLSDEYLTQQSKRKAFEQVATKEQGEPLTKMGWGLGWGVAEQDKSKILWHWGDNGVFRAFVAFEPKSEKAFVYFSNSENGLAIGEKLTDRLLSGNQAIFDWLNYGQSDSPLWQAERKGYELASKKDYVGAKREFLKVLEAYPDNQRLKNKIEWFEPLISPQEKSIYLSKEVTEKIVGIYGERVLFVDKGVLNYRRNKGTAHELKPFYGNVFKVGDLTYFRLEVVFNESGGVEKLVGLYENGYRDESKRTGK